MSKTQKRTNHVASLVMALALICLWAGTANAQAITVWMNCTGVAATDTAKLAAIKVAYGTTKAFTIKLPNAPDVSKRCAFNTETITSNLTLDNTDGSGVVIVTGQILTTAGPIVNPSGKQLFYNATAGLGTVSLTGNTSVKQVEPNWWATNTTPGTTDMGAAIIAAAVAAVTANAPVEFPAGTYAYAVCPNFGFSNLTVQALGKVFLKHTGTGHILQIREASGGELRNVRVLGNFHVYGNASSHAEGVLMEGLSGQSRIELNGRGAPSVMFTNKWGVEASFDLQASSNGGEPWLGPQPITGLRNALGGPSANASPTNNHYKLTIEDVLGVGLVNEDTDDCIFMGTSESNLIGVTEDANCLRNHYQNFYLDGNFDLAKLFTISAATNASPVEFTTSAPHGYTTGDRVTVTGATANWLPANGRWTVTVTSSTKFTVPVDTSTFGALTGTVTTTRNIDLDLLGQNTTFSDIYANSLNSIAVDTGPSTQGLKFYGGFLRSINLNVSSKNTSFHSVQFPDNVGLGISGAGTKIVVGCFLTDTNGVLTAYYPNAFSSPIRATITDAYDAFIITAGTGTNAANLQFANSGNNFYVGQDNSAGSRFFGSAPGAYAATLYSGNAVPMNFYTSGLLRMVIASGGTVSVNNLLTSATYGTATNCADSAGAAACGAAAAGAVVIDAGSTSVVVSTTAVTANSRVLVVFDSSLGTELGVTCNTTAALPFVTARTAATSFTINVGVAPAVNPGCFTYWIVN